MSYKKISPSPIAEGGTALSSWTTNQLICGGTTSTGALQTVSSTQYYPLTSNGSSSLPSYQTFRFLTSVFTLTSSQIKNLHSSPVQLLSAPGSTNYYYVNAVFCFLNYGGNNAFTGSSTVDISYGATAQYAMNGIFPGAFITATANAMNYNFVSQAAGTAAATLYLNQPIYINATGSNFGGNAANDNTVTIILMYTIEAQ